MNEPLLIEDTSTNNYNIDPFEKNVIYAITLLNNSQYKHIRDVILTYTPPKETGYMFDRSLPPEFNELAMLLDHQGHSGASWACLLMRLKILLPYTCNNL